MAFAFGGAGALLKAFIPTFPALNPRRSLAAAGRRQARRNNGMPAPTAIAALSPEAEAALAPLGLPPDGPIDPNAAQRARLTPDVASRNFVRWAQALDLHGEYGTRSVYALYCEFSEVDGRPPLRDTRFLPALAQTEGVATVARGKDKTCRLWRWTIAPAKPVEVVAEAIADVWSHVSAPAPDRAAKAAAPPPDPALAHKVAAPALAPPLAQSAARAPEVTTPTTEAAPAQINAVTAPASAPARASKVAAPAPARAPEPASAPKPTAPAASQALAIEEPQKPTAPQAPAAAASAGAIAAANATAPAKPARSPILLSRFVADTDHPFSPAGLRERQKCARRLRLNAAASRKQRGGVRRAA